MTCRFGKLLAIALLSFGSMAGAQVSTTGQSGPSEIGQSYLKFIAPLTNGDIFLAGALAVSDTAFLVTAAAVPEAVSLNVGPAGWFLNDPAEQGALAGDPVSGLAIVLTSQPPADGIAPVVLSQGLGSVPQALRLLRFENDLLANPPVIASGAAERVLNVDTPLGTEPVFFVDTPEQGLELGPLFNGCGELAGFMLDSENMAALGYAAPAGRSAVLSASVVQSAIEAAGIQASVAAAPCAAIIAPVPKTVQAQTQGLAGTPSPSWTTETGETQALLTDLGRYSGPVDDQGNNDLTAAIRRYQADRGLPNTGKIDPGLLDSLRTEVTAQAAAAASTAASATAATVAAAASAATPTPAASASDEERLVELGARVAEIELGIAALEAEDAAALTRDTALSQSLQAILAELAVRGERIEALEASQSELSEAVWTISDRLAAATAPGPFDMLGLRFGTQPILAVLFGVLALAVLVLLFLLLRRAGKSGQPGPQTTFVVPAAVASPGSFLLTSEAGGGVQVEVPVGRLAEQGATIGRGRDADVVIDDRSVSRLHARLKLENGLMWIEDLGSGNGTVVGGSRLVPQSALELKLPAELELGSASVSIRRASGGAG